MIRYTLESTLRLCEICATEDVASSLLHWSVPYIIRESPNKPKRGVSCVFVHLDVMGEHF